MSKKIAVVGTRQPTDFQVQLVKSLVNYFNGVKGYLITTGGALGVDKLAIDECKSNAVIYLPWIGYNGYPVKDSQHNIVVYDPKKHVTWSESVRKLHPNPDALTNGAFALHARNYGIVEHVNYVIALPGKRGGGTWQSIRIAMSLGIPMTIITPEQKPMVKEIIDEIEIAL